MGTPHRGTDLASWAGLFSNIVNAVSFGQTVRTDLLRDLDRRSATLMEISRQFVQRSVPLQIMSFTEQEIERPLTNLVRHSVISGCLLPSGTPLRLMICIDSYLGGS